MEGLKLALYIIIEEKYKGRTKFDFWKNISIEDILIINMPITKITTQGYVPRLIIENKTNNTEFSCSLTETYKYLQHLKYRKYPIPFERLCKSYLRELFQEIKHGDQEHQDWLENKIEDFIKEKF